MAQLPAVNTEAAACTLSPTGAHHWVLRFVASRGRCRHCGEGRTFQTTYQPALPKNRVVRAREGSDPARARKMMAQELKEEFDAET